MKINQIEPLYEALKEWMDKEISFSLAYKMMVISSAIDKEYQFYITKMRSIIQKYALKDEQGELVVENNQIKVDPNYISAAEKELIELGEIEVTLPDIKITYQELESTDLKISPAQLYALTPILSE